MNREISIDKKIGYGYPIKPPCLTTPDPLSTFSAFISSFILSFILIPLSVFVYFFGALFFFDFFSFFPRFSSRLLTLKEKTDMIQFTIYKDARKMQQQKSAYIYLTKMVT